jgi:hypothetical protein
MKSISTYAELKNQIDTKINKYKLKKNINNTQEYDLYLNNLSEANNERKMLEELNLTNKSIHTIQIKNNSLANSHFYTDIADKARVANIATILKHGKTNLSKVNKNIDTAEFSARSPFSFTLHKDKLKLERKNKKLEYNNPQKVLSAEHKEKIIYELDETVNIKIDADTGLDPISMDLANIDISDPAVVE